MSPSKIVQVVDDLLRVRLEKNGVNGSIGCVRLNKLEFACKPPKRGSSKQDCREGGTECPNSPFLLPDHNLDAIGGKDRPRNTQSHG